MYLDDAYQVSVDLPSSSDCKNGLFDIFCSRRRTKNGPLCLCLLYVPLACTITGARHPQHVCPEGLESRVVHSM